MNLVSLYYIQMILIHTFLFKLLFIFQIRYNQSIAINELFSLKEIVQIFHKDGQTGRQIKLIGRNFQSSLDNEVINRIEPTQ